MVTTLYSIPISNYSAMARDIIYRNNLPVEIAAPADLGGLRSDAYLNKFPSGKMPALDVPAEKICLYESDVIINYLLPTVDNKSRRGALNNLVARIHDMYHGPHQSSLYQRVKSDQVRIDAISAINFALDEYERILGELDDGPFFGGSSLGRGDLIYPTFAFYLHILPNYLDSEVFQSRTRLTRWWNAIKKDEICTRVLHEMKGGFVEWEDTDVFLKLYGRKCAVTFI